MIKYKCSQCRNQMESPTSLAGQTEVCPECQMPNKVPKRWKRTRRFFAPPITPEAIRRQNCRMILALAAAGVLLIGIFLPVVHVPIMGSINLFHRGEGDGRFVALLTLATIGCALLKQFAFLWLTGVLTLGIIAVDLWAACDRLGVAKNEIYRDLADNPFAGLAGVALEGVRLGIGWPVLFLGALAVLVAAGMPSKK